MLLLGGHIQVYRLKKLKKLPPPTGTPSINTLDLRKIKKIK